jgi:hypothetical protein
MANNLPLQIRRGLHADLPILDEGEPGYTTDTHELYIGTGATNIKIGIYCTSFSADIDAIGSSEETLIIHNQQNVIANKTVPSNITLKFQQGGSLNISSGKTVTINGHVEAGLYQIFSGSGTVVFGSGSVKEVYPQWWGAKGDDVADDKAALDAAILAHLHVELQAVTYRYSGKMSGLGVTGRKMQGKGSERTIIHFVDNTVTALVEITNVGFADMRLSGITFKGPGKAEGANIKGFYSHDNIFEPSLNSLEDIRITDVSGDGIEILDWFSSRYRDVGVRNIGGNGIIIGDSLGISFINSGTFNDNVDGYSWWFHKGNPFIQGLNCANVANGIQFGRAPGHPLGAGYCNPVLLGVNIEPLRAGGIGILFEQGSNFYLGGNIQIFVNEGVVALSGIKWEYMMNSGLLLGPVSFQGAGTYSGSKYDGTYASGHGSIMMLTADDFSADCSANIRLCSGNIGLNNLLIPGGRKMAWGTVAPVAGTWKVGDRVLNSIPSVGQPKSWVCTVAGTPGTWVSEGNL